MGRKKRKKRGYPVGISVSFSEQEIRIWRIFSESIKKFKQYILPRKWKNATDKDKYHFYEDLLNLLRPLIDIGLKSIILISPQGTNWSDDFLDHIKKHHRWLVRSKGNNQASFGQISGNGSTIKEVRYILEQEESKKVIRNITSQEAYHLIKELERSININNPYNIVQYGLEEVEDLIYKGGKKDDSIAEKIDYLLLTDDFLENHEKKNRIYRLIQIAENKGIITKVISIESYAGERINQFGGVISFKTIGYHR